MTPTVLFCIFTFLPNAHLASAKRKARFRLYIYICIYIHILPYFSEGAFKFPAIYIIHSFISIQPFEAGLAGTRDHSCDRYGSGTLHPGQVLWSSLPLLSPVFRRCTFAARCLYVRNDATYPSSERWNCGREILPVILPKFRLTPKFRDLLHAANLRQGTNGFTSPPKEGVLRIFSP